MLLAVKIISMNNLIVERKFITSSSSEKLQSFRQVKEKLNTIPSYSTIFYDRENTQSIQSQLKENSKQYQSSFNQPYNKPEVDSDALTYSRTGSMLLPEETLPLLKTIISLLHSKQHIASHVSHSLGVKGYKSQLSTEIGKIIANSFGEYISIAQVLAAKILKEEPQEKEDRIMSLNRELASLKMQNAKLFQKNTKIEEENHMLKRRMMSFKKQQRMSNQNLREQINGYEKQIATSMSRMNTFQSQIYRRLSVFQNTLIQVSNFRNQMMLNTSSIHRWKGECEKYKEKLNQLQRVLEIKESALQRYALKQNSMNNRQDMKRQNNLFKMIAQQKTEQCEQLKKQLSKIAEQVTQQKKLYDQMLDKNIALEKEVYFLTVKDQNSEDPSDSLHIVEQSGVMGKLQYESGHYPSEFCGNI